MIADMAAHRCGDQGASDRLTRDARRYRGWYLYCDPELDAAVARAGREIRDRQNCADGDGQQDPRGFRIVEKVYFQQFAVWRDGPRECIAVSSPLPLERRGRLPGSGGADQCAVECASAITYCGRLA